MTMPITNANAGVKGKKRGVSIGGEGLYGNLTQYGKGDELSPRRKARRSMQPRKSILKSLSSQSVNNDAEDETVNFTTHQYAHTIAFGSSTFVNNENVDPARERLQRSISRRVSFAPNAHVRMFEKPENSGQSASTNVTFNIPPSATSAAGARQSTSSHSRRSSIQNIGSISRPNPFAPGIFQGQGEVEGEASMDIETDEEASDSDDEAVEMGAVRRYDGDGLAQASPGDANAGLVDAADDVEEEDEDDMELDMDMTQNSYGGIIRRASMAANTTVDSEGGDADVSQRSADDEKTMDFTIAIGGLLPHSPPVGAMANRQSIGYSTPAPPGSVNYLPGQAVAGEVEVEMEETVAFGGIIGADDTISSGSEMDTMNGVERERTMTFTVGDAQRVMADDDDGMDMTVAQGGIISFPPASPARTVPTNTRPMSGTPSFARSTVSSVQKSKEKEKRNVFAPSPSPVKSATPRKSGIETAGEVAKRLSFGSTTSSGSKKRARDADEGADNTPINGKKNKVDPINADEVFGGTPVLREPAARRPSLGTPMRLARSPASRKSMVRVFDPEAEDDAVEDIVRDDQALEPEWEQPQTISLAAFLEMSGVQFMEGLPGLLRRRSSVAKGVLGHSYGSGDREFALHEYAEAQVNSIFLNMYSWAANKLREDIKMGQEELAAVEARCDLDSPPVIQEYLAATDEDKPLFEMTFKSFKTNTHLKAKEMWYDWKQQLMETIQPDVEGMLQGMSEDNERLSAMSEQLATLLPDLKARQAALQAELMKEREAVAEITACDQEELAALKEGIAEQGTQITNFNSELSESMAKLNALTSKLDELNAKKQECVTAITHAKSQCDQFTRSDAIRLQEEYTSIQHLHHWRPTKILPDRLELEYDNEISLVFTCKGFVAQPHTAKAVYLQDSVRTVKRGGVIVKRALGSTLMAVQTPTMGLFDMLSTAVEEMGKAEGYQSLPEFIQRVGQLWSTAQRIRAELHYVNFRHPIRYAFDEETASLVATVTLVLPQPQVKSKIELDLIVSQETLWGYPESLAATDVVVRQIYGKADVDLLNEAARQTMSVATAQGCMGAFLQVCVDVGAQYDGRQ